MNHIAGSERSEVLLLPEALEDYIAPENPVRFIDAFVARLDLVQAGFRHAQPALQMGGPLVLAVTRR